MPVELSWCAAAAKDGVRGRAEECGRRRPRRQKDYVLLTCGNQAAPRGQDEYATVVVFLFETKELIGFHYFTLIPTSNLVIMSRLRLRARAEAQEATIGSRVGHAVYRPDGEHAGHTVQRQTQDAEPNYF
jgi:hypothetical protein